MQLTLSKRRKCHFFADYFGKHFPCDLQKADEYGIPLEIEKALPFEYMSLGEKE
jgi:hypothetical protein